MTLCCSSRFLLAFLLALSFLCGGPLAAAPEVTWLEAEAHEKVEGTCEIIDETVSDYGAMAKAQASGERFIRFGPGARLSYPPVTLRQSGERAVWVRSFLLPDRRVTVLVDGKEVGTTAEDGGIALVWHQVGTVRLDAGAHRVELRAAAGNKSVAYVDTIALLAPADSIPTGRTPGDILSGSLRVARVREAFAGEKVDALHAKWILRPPAGTDTVVALRPNEDDGALHIHNGSGQQYSIISRELLDLKPGDQVTVRVRVRKGTLMENIRVSVPGIGSVAPQLYKDYRTTEYSWLVPPGARGPFPVQVTGAGGGDTYFSLIEAFRPDPPLSSFVTGRFLPPPSMEREGRLFEIERYVVNREAFSEEDEDGDGRWSLCRLTREENAHCYFSRGTVLKSDSVKADRPSPEAGCPPLHVRVGPLEPGKYQVHLGVPSRALAYSPDGKEWTRLPAGKRPDLGIVTLTQPYFEFWLDDRYADPTNLGPTYVDFIRFLPIEDPAYTMAPASAPTPPARGSVARRRVALTVQNPGGARRVGEPVRSGVPIPRGELADSHHARLLDAVGKEVPAHLRVTGRWPDGSVKWLLVEFQATVDAKATRRLALEYGYEVKGTPAPAGIRVQRQGNAVTVDTGAARAVFDARGGHFALFRRGEAKPALALAEARFRAADGRVWQAPLGDARVDVEEESPLSTTVRLRGRCADANGPGPLAFDVRVHLYAGRAEALVEYAFFATEAEPVVPLSEAVLRFTGPWQGATARFGVGGSAGAPVPVAERPSLLQTGVEEFGAKGPFPFSLRDRQGRVLTKGERAEGWVRLDGPAGPALFCLPYFWQQFPKGLSCDAEGVAVALWPAGEGIAPFQAHAGAGKSHRVGISLEPSADPERFQTPLFACAEPEWYCASGAFEELVPRRAGRYPRYEEIVDAGFDGMMQERAGYGMENWGDVWQPGYVPGAKTWSNQEWDLVNNWLVPFARTGDRRFLDYAHEASRHYADVDCIHFARNEHLIGAPWMHCHTTLQGHQLEAPNFAHAGWIEGMLNLYHLTGDRRGLEAAEGIARYICRLAPQADRLPPGGPAYNLVIQRSAGWPLTTLCLMYRETWDPVYLQTARRIVDYVRRCQDPERGAWDAQVGHEAPYRGGCVFAYTLLRGLRLFGDITGEERARRDYVAASRWILGELWRPDHRYLYEQCPMHEPGTMVPFTLSEMGGYATRLSGDPIFAAVAYHALAQHSVQGKESWMARESMRSQWGNGILQQVPRMLHDWERTGLTVEDRVGLAPTAARIRIPTERPGRVTLLLRNESDLPLEGLTASCLIRGDWSARVVRCPQRVAAHTSAEVELSVEGPSPLARYERQSDLAHVQVLVRGQQGGRPRAVWGYARLEVANALEVIAPAAVGLKPGSRARLELAVLDGVEERPQVVAEAATDLAGISLGPVEVKTAGEGAVSVSLPVSAAASAAQAAGAVKVTLRSGKRRAEFEVPVKIGKFRVALIESETGSEWMHPYGVLRNYPGIAVEYLPASRLAALFPSTAAEIAARWETVVLAETDKGAAAFSPAQLAALAEFVRAGGGLMLVGGARCYTPGGYAETPLRDLLPVDMTDGAYEMGDIGAEVLERDAVFFEGYEPVLPRFGAHQRLRAKPGARVLARFTDGAPFATLGQAGKGRVLCLGAIWNHGSGKAFREWPHYGRFIGRCVRWTARDVE